MKPPQDEGEAGLLAQVRAGRPDALGQLVTIHDAALRCFLHRLTAHRADADDLAQETWLRVQRRFGTFKDRAAFRTWVFAIATNLARDHWRVRQRWSVDTQDRARALAESTPGTAEEFRQVEASSPRGRYELREHVDFCFTCVMKTLPLRQHLALLLAEIHGFKDRESAEIMGESVAQVKHLLHAARATMNRVFEWRCALVGKTGACHQCSELNGFFNGANLREQAKVARLRRMLGQSPGSDTARLLRLRAALVRQVDPMQGPGSDLQDTIMRQVRKAVRSPN